RVVEADCTEHAIYRAAHRRRPVVLVRRRYRPNRSQANAAEYGVLAGVMDASYGWRGRRHSRAARASGIEEHRIGNKPSRNPLVTDDQPGGVREIEFRHALIAGRTLAVVGLDVGLVAFRNLRKIDLNAAPHGEAPFVAGLNAGEGRVSSLDVVAVIARRDLMGAQRDRRATPGLLHREWAAEI